MLLLLLFVLSLQLNLFIQMNIENDKHRGFVVVVNRIPSPSKTQTADIIS